MARRPVPRGLRLLNLLLLFVFLAGAGTYARAWFGMDALTRYQPSPTDPPFAAMARFHAMWELSITGIWLVWASVLGAVAVAVAAVIVRRRADRAEAAEDARANEGATPAEAAAT